MTEYAAIAGLVALGLMGFLPLAMKMFEAYVRGFYLVLSCPFP